MKATVISLLEEGYSPEQIKGRSNVEGFAMVSHETIYRWIWEDKYKNGTLHLNLRRKVKKYNKRGNLIHTITADNGKEFAKHQEIAKELDISFYFCKPCAILGNVVLMRIAPKRDLVISQQTRNLIYY